MARVESNHPFLDYRLDLGSDWIEYVEGTLVKVSILGLGKSGYASALFLKKQGYEVFVSEKKDSQLIQEKAKQLRSEGIQAEVGIHSRTRLVECDWAIFSPGIPPQAEIYEWFNSKKIPIYSEIEVASWFSKAKRVVAVTGSCGKTTVTTLLGRVLKEAAVPSIVCGNIGDPWIGEIDRMNDEHTVVLELSSFQLEFCRKFKADVALLLNFFPNHLDWHPDLNHYLNAKLKIFQNQTKKDHALFLKEDQVRLFNQYPFMAQVHPIEGKSGENPNEMFVREAVKSLGLSEKYADTVLRQFRGLPHRLEKVDTIGGVDFINDSKSTTTASLKWALEKQKDGSVFLLAGGVAKSNDFEEVQSLIGQKCKKVFVFGQAEKILCQAWKNATTVASLDQATREARSLAEGGDVILLSPACASFDMFLNYEDRGEKFKEIVRSFLPSQKQNSTNLPSAV